MSSWAKETAEAVYTAFRLCFGRGDTCHLTRLPAELFINNIFHYLLVEELVRLRQVCFSLSLRLLKNIANIELNIQTSANFRNQLGQ